MRRSYIFFKAYMLHALPALHTAAREKKPTRKNERREKKQHFMWKSKKKTSSTTTIPRQRVRLHRQLCDGNCRRGIQIQLVRYTYTKNVPGRKAHTMSMSISISTHAALYYINSQTFGGAELSAMTNIIARIKYKIKIQLKKKYSFKCFFKKLLNCNKNIYLPSHW